ncbi:Zn-dependent peptidase ImmA (M78 family) [Sphingomonas sp. PP-F2F-A104-K0414]|nr:Zn-dependent peptidase ImmA (M78 family) [Sphingomonas sp. PP-F2F-A104-K0414]
MATLSQRTGVPKSVLNRTLEDKGELDEDQIRSISEELAVPIQALFARQQLNLFPAVDFRSVTPGVGEFEKGTLQAINFVERLSSTITALDMDVELDDSVEQFTTTTYSQKEAIDLAKKWRKTWGISDNQQLEWQNANKLYTSLRDFIEGLGVLVLHRQFKTREAAGLYLQADNGPHTIVINTTGSSKARKLFTLAHEFGHLLLRAEGASNPSVLKNKVERFCNRFAACLLAPRRIIELALDRFGYTPRADDTFIRLFAAKLGISQEATYLRMVELNYLTPSDYAKWKAKFANNGSVPTGDLSDGAGGGSSDVLRDKQTQYGSTLLNLLARARRTGQLDEIDIFRLCGLKPKYQNQLFGVA